MKLARTAIAAALGFGILASASATPIDNLFSSRIGEFLLTDTSGEILVKGVTGTASNVSSSIQVNDYLVGALNFESLSNPGTPIGSASRELTALFATQISAIETVNSSGSVSNFAMAAPGDAFWVSQLGAANYGSLLAFTGLADMSMVAGLMFEDGVNQFDRGDGIAASFVEAGDGVLRAVVGFDGIDDFWIARGPSDLAAFAVPGSTTNALGHFNFGLSFLYENIVGEFLDQAAGFSADEIDTTYSKATAGASFITPFSADAQLVGDGSLFRPVLPNDGVTDPFPVYNKVDITLYRIPEPGTMALTGLALLGLGLSRRRSKTGD